MLTRDTSSRLVPTFITLLVVGVLLMTIDVRLEGKGVVGVLRSGTQAIVAPLQEVAAFVVNPVADMFDSLTNVASLREQNVALRAELADAQAELVAVQDQLAVLALLEQLYGLDSADPKLGQTVANVIGKVDAAFVVDKGTNDGVVVGQPVIDTNGYVVGTVMTVTSGSATIVPITAGRNGLTVLVNAQVGTLTPQVNTSEMRLLIGDAREPVLQGDRVVTSAGSIAYPAGLPVGVVLGDAAPESNSLTASVAPYLNTDTLRIVVILAWPPDPVTAATDDAIDVEETTTTTSGDSATTTSTPENEG
ncbi:MAG TPA: rod shape-determining protein MreC [Acidimicrobiia bacterium]|nr:rod shape-determining protein MreC [Acidimicrobiia bacterium]